VVNNIELKEKQERRQTEVELTVEEKQCKVCFNADAEMINEICGHILMCGMCARNFLGGRMHEGKACPICRTIGRYFKYKKPFYS
jgi:rubrerythrin